MSWWDYKESVELKKNDPGFYSLIMAAIRKADSHNLVLLEGMWPELVGEMKARYNAPGGVLPTDSESVQVKILGRAIVDNSDLTTDG